MWYLKRRDHAFSDHLIEMTSINMESEDSVPLKGSITDLRLSCSQRDNYELCRYSSSFFFFYVQAMGTRIAKVMRYVPNSL